MIKKENCYIKVKISRTCLECLKKLSKMYDVSMSKICGSFINNQVINLTETYFIKTFEFMDKFEKEVKDEKTI